MKMQATYKLYKAKKIWVTALAATAIFAVAGMQQNVVHADSQANTSQSTNSSQSVTDDNLKVTVDQSNFLQYFKLAGTATYDSSNNLTTLTTDGIGEDGNVTLKTKINANDAFVLHGTINIGTKLDGGGGADGIGIAFHHGPVGAIGHDAGGISVKGLPTSTGFVFDTWVLNNGDHHDVRPQGGSYPYLAGFNSDVDQTYPDAPFRYSGQPYDIEPTKVSGKDVPFTLSYDGNGHMTMSYLDANITIPVTDFKDPLALSIGASTGAFSNLQTVRINDFTFDPAQNNTVSRTVNYVDQNGNKIAPSTVQSAIYRRQGTLVNGQPTYTDWYLASQTGSDQFDQVNAPSISGYNLQAGQTTSYAAETVNQDSGQTEYNIVYNRNTGQSLLNVQDSTIVAGPNAQWQKSDNFLSGYDQNGNQVDVNSNGLTVSGNVNPKTPGDYPVTYSYKDSAGNTITKTATVHVVASQSSLSTSNSTLLVGSKWNPADNVSGTDENGNSLNMSSVQVSGTVDTTKPGAYPVTYTYTDPSGNVKSETATITVVNNETTLNVKNDVITIGHPWDPYKEITSVTNSLGQKVDPKSVTYSGTVKTNEIGRYPVKYTYQDQGQTVHGISNIQVVGSQSVINANSTTINQGDKWNKYDNFVSAKNVDGSSVDKSMVTETGDVDTSRPGQYVVEYSFDDMNHQPITKRVLVTVLAPKPAATTPTNQNNGTNGGASNSTTSNTATSTSNATNRVNKYDATPAKAKSKIMLPTTAAQVVKSPIFSYIVAGILAIVTLGAVDLLHEKKNRR